MKTENRSGTLRIIGGQWRSRRLEFPAVAQLRPTGDRIRETLFNWLQNDVTGASCLDLFAGSGACGLEALSRGARRVTFVERNPMAAAAIEENLGKLAAAGATVVCADVMHWLARGGHSEDAHFGIVFVDPPYTEHLEYTCCQALESSGLLKTRALVYLESARELIADKFPDNWRILKQKKAGSVYYGLLERRVGVDHG